MFGYLIGIGIELFNHKTQMRDVIKLSVKLRKNSRVEAHLRYISLVIWQKLMMSNY